MALIDLKSDLSWYGKKSPGPWTPSNDRADTKFKLSNNVISVQSGGYSFDGTQHLSPITLLAADSFQIDNVTFSDRGVASRKAQLGNGTKFPIGPEGQVHQFDKTRIGFSDESKYGDQYGVKFKNSGLADTYTANSPIDDMYNKFNLRDDATPNSYIKHPLILRGIQRKDNSDPQRFGIPTGPGVSGAFDIPRGGIVTALERSALDAARIGKFLVSPKGIGFLAKQFGYQLMNPNIENILGTADGLSPTQLYNPLSAPGQGLVQGLLGSGKFTRHTGIANLPLGGGGEYGTIKLTQKVSNLLLGTSNGRMLKLYDQYEKEDGIKGLSWRALTALKGPGSILGLGLTTHTRSTVTDLAAQKSAFGGIPNDTIAGLKDLLGIGGGKPTYNTSFGDTFYRWSLETSYEKGVDGDPIQTIDDRKDSLSKRDKSELATSTDNSDSTTVGTEKVLPEEPFTNEKPYVEKGKTPEDIDDSDKSLKNTYTDSPEINKDRGGRGAKLEGGGIPELKEGNIINDYTRMSYGAIPTRTVKKGNKDSRITNHFDFRSEGQSQALKIGWESDKQIDEIDGGVDTSLIKFQIGKIKFKAYLGSLNDTFAPGWNGEQDQGRADSRYLYQSFERTISTDFIVPIYSADDRATIWNKLQDLARITYPVYKSNGFYGQATKLTIGDMYKNKDVIITDLSYDWDAETPWEITEGQQAPFYTNVSIGFTMLDSKPSSGTKIYGNI